ncbi:MAG: GyrI-like domain-containing protein [Spirochaetia bacterium]|nr:GyrI-like domain-containing protein [Spirochaetia bacterium]
MQQIEMELEGMSILGISDVTKNQDEVSGTGKIPGLWKRFFQEGLIGKIPGAITPGNIAVLYTDMESDEAGSYRIVVGALVIPTDKVPEGMILRTLPAQKYVKFTTPVGPLSRITVEAWKKIWADTNLKSRRRYSGDLELYDSRASDPENAAFDILVSVR